jgi:acetyltransferase
VALNLVDDDALRRASSEMLARVRDVRPQARISGFTVQAMIRRPMAQELIVGASVDPTFGPVLLFGQGGTAVEVLADRAIALPPLNRVLARELISRTRVAKLLAGYRDHPAAKLDAIADVLIALSQMLADLPELAELDINPLLSDDRGVIALDARLRVSRSPSAGTERFAILPYPDGLSETVAWNGLDLVLRPIRPEDEASHLAFIQRLKPEDLRLRFFSVRRTLPRSELARLVQIDYAREMAFIALAPGANGVPETLGVVRAVADPDNREAEFAVIVRSDLKGHGLGELLMNKLLRYLRSRGTQRVVGDVLHENRPMRDLAESLGFRVDDAVRDDSSLHYVLDLAAEGGEAVA